MKTCTICNQTKEYEEFGILSRSSDGHYPQCKICKKQIDAKYYEEKKHKVLETANRYYEQNKESILQKRSEKKEQINEYNKQYKQDNKQYIKEYNKQYRLENEIEIKEQRQKYRKENRDKINSYTRKRLRTNPLAKLAKKLRNRLSDFLKNDSRKFGKKRTEEYLGCDLPFLKQHLESQFKPGMTWENHGTYWHIDHRVPLIEGKTEDAMYKLAKWENLQPLEIQEHIQKTKEDNKRLREYNKVCHQKKRRDELLEEDIKNGCPINIGAKDFVLAEEKITKEHRDFIQRYEWLGSCGFGVRYVFTARYNGLLGGVVMIAEPNSYQFDKNLEALIQRGACASWTPKNLGSRLIMFSCRWMLNNTSKRIFTAYSDPEANEIGTIYQACNFDYLGSGFGSEYQYELPNGKLVGTRYFTRTSAMKKWAKELGIEWKKEWLSKGGFQLRSKIPEEIKKQLDSHAKKQFEGLKRVKKEFKGKYVLLLKNKNEKIEKTWVSQYYPKR